MAVKLAPGEQVRVRTRSHPRALTVPVIRLLLVAAATGYLQGLLARPHEIEALVQARPWLVTVVWGLAAVAVLVGTVRPLVRWLTRKTLLTTQRVIQQAGWGRSRERAVHLLSLMDVTVRQKRGQRRAGSGDLILSHTTGHRWVLAEMPEAARFRDLILGELGSLRRQIAHQAHPYSAQQGHYGHAADHRPGDPYQQEATWTSAR